MVNVFRFFNQDKYKLYILGLLSTVFLMVGNFLFISSNIWFVPFGVYIAFTFVYLCMSYYVGIFSSKKEILDKKYSSTEVDIFLPVCGEPINVLRNTWEGVELVSGFVHVYVLDDGKSDQVKDLAKEFGFHYIRRPTNELKKAGNMRYAFSKTSSPFILILDADFKPHPEILEYTLPYFQDQKVAIVQTPQWFQYKESNSWIKNAAGSIQELFYRLIQVNRDWFGGAICVGTNAVYRRSALEPFGGTAPIEYSEDVHTGFQLLKTGWKIRYIPLILASGECPDTIKQYFTQQYRWSLGSISLFFSRNFWSAPITFMQRVCYLTGMFYYMTTGLGVIFVGIPSIVMLSFFPEKILWYNLIFSIPSFIYSTVFMYYWMIEPMNLDVIRARYISYYAHLFALKDYLLGTLEEWKPTGSKTSSARFDSFKNVFKIHNFIVIIVISSLVLWRIYQGQPFYNFILLWFFFLYHIQIVTKIYRYLSE